MKTFSFVPEVFSVEAAAYYLGVSERTVDLWIKNNMIRTFRHPSVDTEGEFLKRTLIRKAELDKFLGLGTTI